MKTKKQIFNLLILLIGSIGITLSGINWHMGLAAWIAPIFLLMYVRRVKWLQMILFFIAISIAGAITQSCNNFMHIPAIHVFNGISFGILSSIPYVIDKLLYKQGKCYYHSLIFPAAIALVEYLASLAIGNWGSMAHTQYGFKAFMQLGSVTGIYGIWFLISWFASTVNWILENKYSRPAFYKASITWGSIFFLVLIYGFIRINSPAQADKKVKVAMVLSEYNIHKTFAAETDAFKELASNKTMEIPVRFFSSPELIEGLVARTNEAVQQGANIVVWNEIALILTQKQKQELVSEVKEICTNNKVYILLSFVEECALKNKKPFNNINILISPSGKTEWEYKKSFLEPNAEATIVNAGDFNLPVLETGYGKIGSVICADLDMQHYLKQAGKKVVDILLVPAFDWAEITPLHSQMASIQAIQFGCNIVRSNGQGLSAVYDFKGKELAALNNLTSEDKTLLAEIPVFSKQTIYSQIGDTFIVLCLLFMIFILVKNFLKPENTSS